MSVLARIPRRNLSARQRGGFLAGSRLPLWWWGASIGLAVGCGGDKGDSAAATGSVPDIVGRYNTIVLGVAGCEGDPVWIDDWARGRLDVTGAGDSPTFDFGDDAVFAGSLEADGGFRFAGAMDFNGASLSLSGTGVAGVAPTDPGDGSQARLTGDITVVVSQEGLEDCTIEGPFEATELVDSER